jgi:hypothetical protein
VTGAGGASPGVLTVAGGLALDQPPEREREGRRVEKRRLRETEPAPSRKNEERRIH